jgi:hypothetical protein
MTGERAFSILRIGAEKRSAAVRFTPEKSDGSNDFHDERRGDGGDRRTSGDRRRSCRIETTSSVPRRDGPQFSAAFAAQVIGQILAGDGDGASAQRTYRRAGTETASKLDERI